MIILKSVVNFFRNSPYGLLGLLAISLTLTFFKRQVSIESNPNQNFLTDFLPQNVFLNMTTGIVDVFLGLVLIGLSILVKEGNKIARIVLGLFGLFAFLYGYSTLLDGLGWFIGIPLTIVLVVFLVKKYVSYVNNRYF